MNRLFVMQNSPRRGGAFGGAAQVRSKCKRVLAMVNDRMLRGAIGALRIEIPKATRFRARGHALFSGARLFVQPRRRVRRRGLKM